MSMSVISLFELKCFMYKMQGSGLGEASLQGSASSSPFGSRPSPIKVPHCCVQTAQQQHCSSLPCARFQVLQCCLLLTGRPTLCWSSVLPLSCCS